MALFRNSVPFEFPGPTDRVTVVGATSSGKSTFALWLFSESADFNKMPYIVVDYKGEEIVQAMIKRDDAEVISMSKPVPKYAGIYVIKPSPRRPEEILDYLWQIYERGKIGVFFDELMILPKQFDLHNNPLQALLTQGRSKHIPLYLLSQRPARVNVSVFSEATYISEFELNKADDRNRVREYIPDTDPVFASEKPLPRHWSRWWDSKRRVGLVLKPSPGAKEILDTISRRVDKMRAHQKL